MSETEIDKDVEQRLLQLMREEPVKLIGYFLVILGKEMVECNAATMDISQKSTIEGQRYEIKCKATIKKVKEK